MPVYGTKRKSTHENGASSCNGLFLSPISAANTKMFSSFRVFKLAKRQCGIGGVILKKYRNDYPDLPTYKTQDFDRMIEKHGHRHLDRSDVPQYTCRAMELGCDVIRPRERPPRFGAESYPVPCIAAPAQWGESVPHKS